MTLDQIKALPRGEPKQLDELHEFVIDKTNNMLQRRIALTILGDIFDPEENDTVKEQDVEEYTDCFTGNIRPLTSGS